MKNLTVVSCLFVSIFLILQPVLCSGAEEINYYEIFMELWEKSKEEARQYGNSLSPEKLLIMGKQACEANPEEFKQETPFWFFPGGILSKWLEKSKDNPDIDELIRILKDKDEVEGWRICVGQFLSRICRISFTLGKDGKTAISQEDLETIFILLNDEVLFWDELPLLRIILCRYLSSGLKIGFFRIKNMPPGSPETNAFKKAVQKNISSLFKVIEVTKQPKGVIEVAIESLCGFYEMGFPQKDEIKAELLKVYKSRDKYDEETREVIEKYIKKLAEEAESKKE